MANYIDPDALLVAIQAGRDEEVGALLLLLARRVVRGKAGAFPAGLDPDDVISTAVLEAWKKLPKVDPAKGASAAFSYLTGSILLTLQNMCKLQATRNSRHESLPDESRDERAYIR